MHAQLEITIRRTLSVSGKAKELSDQKHCRCFACFKVVNTFHCTEFPRQSLQLHVKIPGGVLAWRHRQQLLYEEQFGEPKTDMKRVIFHYGLFKIIWDWFVLLLVLYTAVEVPFVVTFVLNDHLLPKSSENSFRRYYNTNRAYFAVLVVDLVVDLFFFCDIVVNFRTTYIGRNDVLVTCPRKIAIRYLRTYFIVDLVAAIPWDVIAGPYAAESTTSLSLLKTVRLLRLFQAARRLDQNYEKSVSLLFLMVFAFTLVAHWLACIWYSIGYSESRNSIPRSWLLVLAEESEQPINDTAGLLGPSLRSRYLTSLYFTLTCLTSVGFGNVSANTDFEKLFTIVSMLIGGLLFAAVFGNVSAIIYGHYSGTFKFRERMQSVKYFLGFHKIKGPLARKIKDYARHMWTQTKGISAMKIMKQFPQNLQEEICSYLHFEVIKKCPLFESADQSCLWSLATRMIRLHHLPNNIIVRQGAIVKSVYFINRGRLDVLRNGAVVGSLGEGDTFGNLSLNRNSQIHKSAVALRCSCCVDIHILDLKDLNEILGAFPEFSKELRKKTSTILRKTVLTSQILSSWDAMEVEESCPEHQGLLTTWIGRQKSKRKCNVDKDNDFLNSGKARKRKAGINETLVALPFIVLSPACSSSDDVQKLWRFANIIECRNEETNRKLEQEYRPSVQEPNDVSKKLNHGVNNGPTEKQQIKEDMSDEHENRNDSDRDSLGHSHNCEFHELQSEEEITLREMNYKRLESTVYLMNNKLQALEDKMDIILQLLQDRPVTES